ncbi:CDP-alcohol phosphatidyltransferase family protein [Methanococcus maripaludis]|uniref:Phosphatidylglycerophosphate synthase n=1 Tax=Methanococcus maripaludis TaxID=39152 RepID=A0A7J9RXB2_METMI|nr:CDP-alcohol phosphatidyltransferase family protein [Methanococcus maripaludis]MBB6066836.1 phosphatidylglycerophosphate synthase [Methanococcus maripaludis]
MKDNKIYKNITEGTGLIDHYIYREIVYLLIKKLKLNVNPNIVTLFSLIYAISSAFIILSGHVVIGSVMYMFFNIFDLMDGAIARIYRRKSTFGAFIDGLVDLIGESCVILALGVYFNVFTLSLAVLAYILLTHYISIRKKWIYDSKELQKNMMDYTKKPFLFGILVITRNDFRKLIILYGAILNSWELIMSYFFILYSISLINSLIGKNGE